MFGRSKDYLNGINLSEVVLVRDTIRWKSRSGEKKSVTFTTDSIKNLKWFFVQNERKARELGYEGHAGGWLRYKVADWLKARGYSL